MGYEGNKDTWHVDTGDTTICGIHGTIRGKRGYMGHKNTWDIWDTKMQDIGIQGDRDMGIHLIGYEI